MAKHVNLIWGSTGEGKSALLHSFAKGMFEATGKKTRLLSAEKAQSEGVMREGLTAGYIQPYWIDSLLDTAGAMVTPFERLTQAMMGWWPEEAENPYSRLLPAFAIAYKAVCRLHTPAVDAYRSEKAPNAAALKCPKCSAPVIVETERVLTDSRLNEVGAYFIEGLTEFGAIFMRNLEQRAAKGEKTGGDIPVAFQDGAMLVGSPTRGHYGTSQAQLKNRVTESKHLPVDYVWWTAGREDGKDDERGGLEVFGPKLPGHAVTADVPRWFGTTLSACSAPVDKGIEYRLYLQKYYQDWIQVIAKKPNLVNNRIPPERLKGIPPYITVDHSKESLDVAGVKMKPATLLWHVTQLIEARQKGE